MKKLYSVTAYEAYDCTKDWRIGDLCKTISEAESSIYFDDAERLEKWRQSQWYNHGRVNPFEHHDYDILEWVGNAEIDVEYEDYEPSFYELCEAVEEWREGEYHKEYEF